MPSFLRTAVFAATGFLCACASHEPQKMALAPDSKDGVILLRLVPVPPSKNYSLSISPYDPAKGQLQGDLSNTGAYFDVLFNQPYVAQTLSPGAYVLNSIGERVYWFACFQDGSYSFEVKPGEVLYLGTLDSSEVSAAITRHALTEGPSSASQPVYYFDGIPAPNIGFPEGKAQAQASAEDYVKTAMPKVTAPVRLAELKPAKFGTGHDLFGVKRVCGGYYKQPAKQ